MSEEPLIDRIGVHATSDGHPADDTDPLRERATTDLHLPLSTADLDSLMNLIEATIHGHGAPA